MACLQRCDVTAGTINSDISGLACLLALNEKPVAGVSWGGLRGLSLLVKIIRFLGTLPPFNRNCVRLQGPPWLGSKKNCQYKGSQIAGKCYIDVGFRR